MYFVWITFFTLLGTGLCIKVDDCPAKVKDEDLDHLKVLKSSCFQFCLSDEKDFEEAQEVCKENGGHLAMPKDAETSKFLFETLAGEFDFEGRVYIGLNDIKDEGKYIWEDQTYLKDGKYSNWAKHKGPDRNIFGRKLKDCITIDTEEDGKWADDQCDKDKHFICEYKVDVAEEKGEEAVEVNKDAVKAVNDDPPVKIDVVKENGGDVVAVVKDAAKTVNEDPSAKVDHQEKHVDGIIHKDIVHPGGDTLKSRLEAHGESFEDQLNRGKGELRRLDEHRPKLHQDKEKVGKKLGGLEGLGDRFEEKVQTGKDELQRLDEQRPKFHQDKEKVGKKLGGLGGLGDRFEEKVQTGKDELQRLDEQRPKFHQDKEKVGKKLGGLGDRFEDKLQKGKDELQRLEEQRPKLHQNKEKLGQKLGGLGDQVEGELKRGKDDLQHLEDQRPKLHQEKEKLSKKNGALGDNVDKKKVDKKIDGHKESLGGRFQMFKDKIGEGQEEFQRVKDQMK